MAPTVSLVVAFSYKKISWVKKSYGFQTEKYELFKASKLFDSLEISGHSPLLLLAELISMP